VYLSRKQDKLPIVIDSGASYSVTPNLQDFVGPIEKCSTNELNSLKNSTIKVVGQGTVEWKIQDLFGTVRSVKTMAFYVPDASIRLFSPQAYFGKNKRASLFMDHSKTILTLHDGTPLKFPYNTGSHLLLMLTTKALAKPSKFIGLTFQYFQTSFDLNGSLASLLNVINETNQNLTAAQKELLVWHQKWGHADTQQCQAILSKPKEEGVEQMLKPRNKKASSCKAPICAACQLGKQGHTPVRAAVQQLLPDCQNLLRQGDLQPGAAVSIDQCTTLTHGRLAHTKGKEAKSKQYVGGTIFVDHAITLIHHSSQVSLRVGKTLQAKHRFKGIAKEWGHKILHYHADNAPFYAKEFVHNCTNQDQCLSYSGVGAHHQNGVVERAIRTVTSWARTMMLRQVLHWPSKARLDLWPFALDQAIYLWNNMPKRDGARLSPLELFSGTKFPNYNHLQWAHVWGCPVYVLDPVLQDGKKLPKWEPRAQQGLYVGVSPIHSTTVGRVLNLRTGHFSPQFHCVYDDTFSSVNSPEGGPFDIASFSRIHWSRLIESGYKRHAKPEMDAAGNAIPFPELSDDWLSGLERILCQQIRRERQKPEPEEMTQLPGILLFPMILLTRESLISRESLICRESLGIAPRERAGSAATATDATAPALQPSDEDDDGSVSSDLDFNDNELEDASDDEQEGETQKYRLRSGQEIELTEHNEFTRTRSGRRNIPPDWFAANSTYRKVGFPGQNREAYQCGKKESQKLRSGQLNNKYLNSLNWDRALNMLRGGTLGAMWAKMEQHTDQEYGTVEWMNPALFSAKANKEDNPTWKEAMSGKSSKGYWQACIKEHETLIKKDVWEEVEKPFWMNVIPSTWAFQCKRFPDGLIRKLKL
jgi:hypothetical protein